MNTVQALKEIHKLHSAIENDSKDSLIKAMKIGEILGQQKKELGHGNYTKWIKAELPFVERTARRYLQLYKHKPLIEDNKIETLIDAYNAINQIQQSKLPYQQNNQKKSSTIYTPQSVSEYLHRILSTAIKPKVVLDPAIGKGSLTAPWQSPKTKIIGVDIEPASQKYADTFINGKFEEIEKWEYATPDLILCNPPFNNAGGGNLYPEVFLRKCFDLFGEQAKVILIGIYSAVTSSK